MMILVGSMVFNATFDNMLSQLYRGGLDMMKYIKKGLQPRNNLRLESIFIYRTKSKKQKQSESWLNGTKTNRGKEIIVKRAE